MFNERVADIWFEASGSFGSGYFLTNRLVLTAGHVAKPRAQGTQCLVRRWKLVDEDLPAKVLWASADPDVALIVLDESVAGGLGPDPVFGRTAVSYGGEEYGCVSIGFPSANRGPDEERIDKTVLGTALMYIRGGMLDIRTNVRPAEARGWKGFSGAALFSRDLLFGIVVSVPEAWDGASLNAVPLAPLLADPDSAFRAALAEGGFAAPSLETLRHGRYFRNIAEKVSSQYIFVDRSSQYDKFETALKEGGKAAFGAEGGSRDKLDFLMQRFANEQCFRDRIGDIEPADAIIELYWPDFDIPSPEAAFEKFRKACAGRLSLDAETTKTPADFARALGSRCVAIWWQFSFHRMGPGHGALLKQWTDFCQEVQAQGAALYWFACRLSDAPPPPPAPSGLAALFSAPLIPQRDPDPAAFAVMKELIDSGKVVWLGALNPIIAKKDCCAWLDRIGPARINADERGDLQDRIESRLGMEEMQLADFTEKVETMLRLADD